MENKYTLINRNVGIMPNAHNYGKYDNSTLNQDIDL